MADEVSVAPDCLLDRGVIEAAERTADSAIDEFLTGSRRPRGVIVSVSARK